MSTIGTTMDYSPEQYPVAQKHCATHTCLVMTLRYPNSAETIELIAAAMWKVMENVDQLENA